MSDIEAINESLVNGQRRQMTNQIKAYGSDFWSDFRDFLDTHFELETAYQQFTDAVISFNRITNR